MFYFPVLLSIIYCRVIAMFSIVGSVTISILCIVSSISKIGVLSSR